MGFSWYVYLTYRFIAGDKDMTGSRLQYISITMGSIKQVQPRGRIFLRLDWYGRKAY
jgi:hypothetical protein